VTIYVLRNSYTDGYMSAYVFTKKLVNLVVNRIELLKLRFNQYYFAP